MSRSSVIAKSPNGGYTVTTKANADPLSALVFTPRHASTLWGARRLARKHQARLIKLVQIEKFREEIHPNCRSTQ